MLGGIGIQWWRSHAVKVAQPASTGGVPDRTKVPLAVGGSSLLLGLRHVGGTSLAKLQLELASSALGRLHHHPRSDVGGGFSQHSNHNGTEYGERSFTNRARGLYWSVHRREASTSYPASVEIVEHGASPEFFFSVPGACVSYRKNSSWGGERQPLFLTWRGSRQLPAISTELAGAPRVPCIDGPCGDRLAWRADSLLGA